MKVEDIYGDLPTLETKRLMLRKLRLEDAKDVFAYGSDEDVSRYVMWPTHQTLADSESFIKFVLNKYEKKEVAPWGIEVKETGKFIGTVDFVFWSPEKQMAEIGYVISKDYWGRGFVTEATQRIIRFGFEEMNLVRIQGRCLLENRGSARVMEKSGMIFEGVLRKSGLIKGKHQDLNMFSMIRDDYFGER